MKSDETCRLDFFFFLTAPLIRFIGVIVPYFLMGVNKTNKYLQIMLILQKHGWMIANDCFPGNAG